MKKKKKNLYKLKLSNDYQPFAPTVRSLWVRGAA